MVTLIALSACEAEQRKPGRPPLSPSEQIKLSNDPKEFWNVTFTHCETFPHNPRLRYHYSWQKHTTRKIYWFAIEVYPHLSIVIDGETHNVIYQGSGELHNVTVFDGATLNGPLLGVSGYIYVDRNSFFSKFLTIVEGEILLDVFLSPLAPYPIDLLSCPYEIGKYYLGIHHDEKDILEVVEGYLPTPLSLNQFHP